MLLHSHFSWARLLSLIIKELRQLKRDYTTFAMIISIPLIQIILFGFAINNDPKHLPTVVLSADHTNLTRTIISGLENTHYFRVIGEAQSEAQADRLIATGKAQFILNIPANFSRELVRGNHPSLLLDADATDPTSIVNSITAATHLSASVLNSDLRGILNDLKPSPPPFQLQVHARYNPSGITQYNVVPGLMGVILTMTLVMVTAMAITRERERGTIEHLLTTPARPIEVIVGKSLPYVMVGYLQTALMVVMAQILFGVPIHGSLTLLIIATLPFILANLFVGIAFSTLAQNQLQASQMSTFFFLPSILLSGFVFPFRGMPMWAQWIGQALPLTHYVNITRGVMLKGNGWIEVWPDLWPILLFLVVATLLAISRYRQTLD